MSFALIKGRRVAWCVSISGLPYRFCSEVAAGSGVPDGYLVDYNADIVRAPVDLLDSLYDVGPTSAQIDDLAAVAEQEPVEVVIRARDVPSAGTRVHPKDVLMRTAGPPSAELAVKLVETLPHVPFEMGPVGPVDIQIAKSAAAWTLPGPVHNGQEVMWAAGFSDPGGGVHLLTDCTRGADQWVSQEHVVSAAEYEQPWVTSDVTTWHGRRASIWVAAILSDGTAGDWTEYWGGFLDSAPERKGDAITVRIAPMTRPMRYTLGVGSAARTAAAHSSCHMFRVGVGDRLDMVMAWSFAGAWLQTTAANVGTGVITLAADSAAWLAAVRLDQSRFSGETPTDLTGNDLTFSVGSALVAAVDAAIAAGTSSDIQMQGAIREGFPLRLVDPTAGADQIVRWPLRLREVVNEPQAWQPGPIESWADPEGASGESRIGTMRLMNGATWSMVGGMASGLSGGGSLDGRGNATGTVTMIRGRRTCWAGFVAGESVADVQGERLTDGRFERQSEAFGGDLGGVHGSADPTRYPIAGPAVWWYQSGEPYIGPFSANVYTGAGEPQQVRITGQGIDVTMWIVAMLDDASPVDGSTVYWYEVRDPDAQRSIVQMEGDPPVQLQVIAGGASMDPGEYLLRLLVSGVGNADNGAYDTFPIGANVPQGVVSVDDFAGLACPPALSGQTYTAERGRSIEDQVQGLLMACGAHVVSRYVEANGRWQISICDMGPADAANSLLALTDDDMHPAGNDEPVATSTDGRVIRAYEVTLNYPRAGGDGEPLTVPVSGDAERNDGGCDSGEPLEIDLPGVQVTADGGIVQAVAEIIADMRSRVGVPRLRWAFSIPADFPGALALGIGDVLTLTSSYADMVRPTDSVDAVPCRIVGIKRDLMSNTLGLEVRPFAGRPGGWAPSARVATVIDADSITVEADDFSSSDATFILADDKLTGIAPGDWAGRVSLTVATVSGATVNFTGAHTLAVGDILRTQDYATVVARQQVFAFLADDGVLGAGAGRVIG